MKHLIIKPEAIVVLMTALGTAVQAQTSLFTTMDDFLGSSSAQFVATPTNTVDLDGSTLNGLGNLTAAEATGTSGSLSLTWVSGTYDAVAIAPGEQGNAAFLSALENAATLTYDYTTPSAGTGNYFGLGIFLNYPDNYDQLFPDSTTDLGGGVTRATIDFSSEATKLSATQSANGGSFSYFQLGVIYNSNYTPDNSFYVDNFQVVGSVPEPGTMALTSGGAALLLCWRRRKH